MRVFNSEDYQAVIDSLPDSPENHQALQQLLAMRDESMVERAPYTFEVDFSSGAGLLAGAFAAPGVGANTPGNFVVDTSSPFMLVSQTYRADVAGAAATISASIAPNATVLIQEQSSGRLWMNVAVPVTSLFGTAQLPYFLPQPRLIPGNTTVSVTLYNYDAAVTNNVRLSFHGYRLYSARRG